MATDRFSFKKARTTLGEVLAAPVIALTPVNDTDRAYGEPPVTITHHSNEIPTNPDVLLSGHKWKKKDPGDTSPLIITYRFLQNTGKTDDTVTIPYTSEQRLAFKLATEEFERFAHVKFVEFKPGVSSNAADIDPNRPMIEVSARGRLPGINKAGELVEFLGYAPFPRMQYPANTTNAIVASLRKAEEKKSLANYVIHHEIGHNLGLKHPGDSLSTNAFSIPSAQNSVEISIMSDKSIAEKSQFGKEKPLIKREDGFSPSGLMPLDAAALQKMYGANTRHTLGANTYYFQNGNETGTVWNGGKPYTLDARPFNSDENTTINLDANPGRASIVGKEVMFNPLDAMVTTLRGSNSGTSQFKGSEKGGTRFEGGTGANLFEFFGKGNHITTPANAKMSYYAPYPGAEAIVEGFDAERDKIMFPYPNKAAVNAIADGKDMILEFRLGRTDSARMILKNFNGRAQDIDIIQAQVADTSLADINTFKRVNIAESSMPSWLQKALRRDGNTRDR